ncbi:hypothetical protein M432DRAFT_209356 [Thermoascus aurantiacus ATCC 26904]
MASGHESMCSFRELRMMEAWQSGHVVVRLGHSSLTCSCMKDAVRYLRSGKMETGFDTYFEILLHHVFPTPVASVETVHAPVIGAQVLLPSLLVAREARARHELVLAVLVDVGLDVSPGDNLLASLSGERASHADIVAHVDEEARHVHEDVSRRDAAGRAGEVLRTGVVGGDGRVETCLAEDMVALQADGSDEGAVAYRAHEVFIVARDVVEGAEVDEFVEAAIRLHVEELPQLHPRGRSTRGEQISGISRSLHGTCPPTSRQAATRGFWRELAGWGNV